MTSPAPFPGKDSGTWRSQRDRGADDREARLDALAGTLGSDLQQRRERVEEALARSEAKITRAMAAIERARAAGRRDQASQQRHRIRTRRERDDVAYEVGHALRKTMLDLSETITQARAARSHALLLRGIVRDTTQTAAVIMEDTRLARDDRARPDPSQL